MQIRFLIMFHCIFQMICRFGAPEIVITDQGRDFVNELMKELYLITNTQHRITSAYHPRIHFVFNVELHIGFVKCKSVLGNQWKIKYLVSLIRHYYRHSCNPISFETCTLY